jgi:outer membrane biosynthesis protein TonB
MRNIAIICSAIIGVSLLCLPAVAQQKTAKACQEEWRANKAANQAKGITEKAYITQCRGGEAATKPAPAAEKKTTTPPAEKKAATPPAEKKAATPPAEKKAATPTAEKKAATPAPAAAPAKPAAQPAPAATATLGANQYSTEVQAKLRCGSGTVVWANLNSKIYHFAGHKDYGNTKSGAYMCEQDATSQGIRAAKSEKRP